MSNPSPRESIKQQFPAKQQVSMAFFSNPPADRVSVKLQPSTATFTCSPAFIPNSLQAAKRLPVPPLASGHVLVSFSSLLEERNFFLLLFFHVIKQHLRRVCGQELLHSAQRNSSESLSTDSIAACRHCWLKPFKNTSNSTADNLCHTW